MDISCVHEFLIATCDKIRRRELQSMCSLVVAKLTLKINLSAYGHVHHMGIVFLAAKLVIKIHYTIKTGNRPIFRLQS